MSNINTTYSVSLKHQEESLKTRLRSKMEEYGEKGLSNQGLADIIRKRRWQNEQHEEGQVYDKDLDEGPRKALAKQIGRYKAQDSDSFFFPKLQALIEIAEVLGVSVGYLIGEYDYKDKNTEWACEYTGLSEKAIDGIRLATAQACSSDPDYMWHGDSTDILNKMLPSKAFFNLLEEMGRYERVHYAPNQAKIRRMQYEAEHDRSLIEKAYRLHDAFIPDDAPEADEYNRGLLEQEGIAEEESEEFLQITADLARLIDEEIEEDDEKQLLSKAYSFYLVEAFERLIEDLYPH